MSTDKITRLARDVAAVVPLKRGTTTTCKVPWSLIDVLREALDEAGVDWRERHESIGNNKWREKNGRAR